VVKSFNQFSMWNLFCYIPLRHQCISSVLNEWLTWLWHSIFLNVCETSKQIVTL
jgi:hypothetical protein